MQYTVVLFAKFIDPERFDFQSSALSVDVFAADICIWQPITISRIGISLRRIIPHTDSICQSVFRSFCDVEYDVGAFTAASKRMLRALSE